MNVNAQLTVVRFLPTGKDGSVILHHPPSQTRGEGTKESRKSSSWASWGDSRLAGLNHPVHSIFFFLPSEVYEIALPHGSGITVFIKPGTPTLPMKLCHIISSRRKETTLSIKSGDKIVFYFSCQDPENHFVIEIQKNIGKYVLVDALAALPLFSMLSQPLLLER